jgi:hypothetical protein
VFQGTLKEMTVIRNLCLILAVAAISIAPSRAQDKPIPAGAAPVYCGSFTPIYFRVKALGRTPDERALAAMDVLNKYLGGKIGKFVAKPQAKHIRITLNNDLLGVVTLEDAVVEKQKTAEALAAVWVKKLTIAFDASKAVP